MDQLLNLDITSNKLEPSGLESLPDELLSAIAGLVHARSLVAFATASRRLHDVSVAHLAEHQALYASLYMTRGWSGLQCAELLAAILEDPRKAQHIFRWRIGAHLYNGDETDEEDELDRLQTDAGYARHLRRAVPYAVRVDREATRSKLRSLLKISPLVPDDYRSDCLTMLEQSNQCPELHALGLILCDQVHELGMSNGEEFRALFSVLPTEHPAQIFPNVKRFRAMSYGEEETESGLELYTNLAAVMPRLESVELHRLSAEDEFLCKVTVEPCACSILHLILESCQIEPESLASFLSTFIKADGDAAGQGTQSTLHSLAYSFGLCMAFAHTVDQYFHASKFIKAIRDTVGQSLEYLALTVENDALHAAYGSCWGTSKPDFNWNLTRETNLRIGFPRLSELTTGPEFLTGGALPQIQIPPNEPERMIEPQESLPIAVILPETLQVLSLPAFHIGYLRWAAPKALEKLSEHLRTGLDATPKLREVHLMDPSRDDTMDARNQELELAIEEFAKLCEAKNIFLGRGDSSLEERRRYVLARQSTTNVAAR